MHPRHRRRFGQDIEELVARYLEERGAIILARNLFFGHLEIDLVLREGRTVAVVEVRYRGPQSWTTGFGSLDRQKRRRIRAAGFRLWRRHFRWDPSVDHLRFDAASVSRDAQGGLQIRYCKAAF